MNVKNLLMGYHFFNPSSPTNDLVMDGLFKENMTSSWTTNEVIMRGSVDILKESLGETLLPCLLQATAQESRCVLITL